MKIPFSVAKTALDARRRREVIGLIALAALGLWAYYAYAFTPLLRNAWRLGHEVRTRKTQLTHIEQAIAQQPQWQQESVQLDGDVGRLRAALPSADGVLPVIERLSDLANDSGIKIQTITPQRSIDALPPASGDAAPAQPALYKEVAIKIEALGGLHQLGRFLSRLESDPQPVQIRILRVASGREVRRHVIKLVLVGFFSTEPSS